LEWNDLETAEQHATHAVTIGRQVADEDLRARGALLLARLKHVRGETADLHNHLHRVIPANLMVLCWRQWEIFTTEDRDGALDAGSAHGSVITLSQPAGIVLIHVAGSVSDVIIHRLGSAAVRVHLSQIITTHVFCTSCRPTAQSSRVLRKGCV